MKGDRSAPGPSSTRSTSGRAAWVAGGSLAALVLLAIGAVAYRQHRSQGLAVARGDCEGAEACDRACAAGDTCACGNLGALYLHGSSVGRDAKRGLALLDRACDASCATACWTLGSAYENSAGTKGDAARAARYFERLNSLCRTGCDDGRPDRCFTLAGSYMGQHGVASDHARAEELYAKAASLYEPQCQRGSAHACARTGFLLDRGLGLAESKPKATEAYEKACRLGDAESCEEAAKRYTGKDKDLPKDEGRARELGHVACAAGRAVGCAISEEPDAFLRIVTAACDAGSAFDCGSAAFALGHGAHGVARDAERATELAARMIELEQDACLDDDGSACAALVRPFESGSVEGETEGTIVPKDPARVAALRQRACELGFRTACPRATVPSDGRPAPP